MMVNLKINNIDVTVPENTTILDAAKAYNISIPTLCYYPDLRINSDCRICSVEIVGKKGLSTSCSTIVQEGMQVKTHTPRVINARKTITELLLANHDADCTACAKNMNCELQKLANVLGIDENRFERVLEVRPIDDHNPSLLRNPNRCIKCGRCIDVCRNIQGVNVLEPLNRGHEIIISPPFGKYLTDEFCTFCGQCSSVCPVGAIIEKDETAAVWNVLHDPQKHVIVQVAPAIRVSLGEELGQKAGTIVTGKLVSALKLLGFTKVFDTDFTADLTIIEEGNELIKRITTGGVLPMITSCCPGWINFAETYYPEILDHLSSCKSPQQMFGALAKTYYAQKENIDPATIFVVSIMPCTAKKYEAKRPEMGSTENNLDVDVVLTTREIGKMLRQMGVEFENLPETEFDEPFGKTTGAAAIFGTTGGVMEAALRTVYEIVNKKPLESLDFMEVRGMEGIKEASVNLGGKIVKVAVAHTLANAKKIAEQIKNNESPYAFIEVMCCPGGCIGGGGQSYGTTSKTRKDRLASLYTVDAAMPLRKSHENPDINKLYADFLGSPLAKLSHELLHTKYKAKHRHQ
ncbi:MAG: NADH-dependent [FeFe] hydrogenase, group A6 [Candidatus Izemoplasmatales bacterium]|nr:NADH-dependent [FeFe] hydrogenase, group A6 [Candidatus Izemoplasmatales bacterium]